MSRKLILLVLILAGLCVSVSARAATIIWVSDNKTPTDGVPADQGWVDLLTGQGYNVDLSFRNAEGQSLSTAEIDALNAADLIIVSRDTNSGQYDDGTEIADWNGITTPIILQVAHIARSSRWLWLDTGDTNDSLQNMLVVEPAHPIFQGVTIPANNQLTVLTEASSFCNITSAGNGTLIASRADNNQVWIVFWGRGTEFYDGCGQVAGGARLFFASGTNSGTDGRYNLTADGETLFLNAVNYLVSGDFKIRTARNPVPENGKQDVGRFDDFGLLRWTAGDDAAWHNVYFGTNPTPGPAEFKARHPLANTFFSPDRDAGTTYYWRIDEEEVDGTMHPGEVWTFSTAPLKAHAPIPADGANYVDPNTDLTWSSGFDATTHEVYFGTDATAVANATPASDEYQGEMGATTLEIDPLTYETSYYWRVDEKEAAGTRKGDVWSFTTGTDNQGRILREIWRDITPTGTNINLLKNWWKYPSQPDDSNLLTSFNSPQLDPATDQYGGRIHGWLHVPTPGEYTFWLSSDDNGELWLSTDDDPGNAVLIANVPGYSSASQWVKFPEQKSAAITLESEKYYIMAIWKEGTGGDHCEVSWQGPASPSQQIITGAYLSPYEALWAWSPSPSNRATGVDRTADLTWQPGIHAASHKVYFGTNPDALALKATLGLGNESYDPGPLAWETTYYWRVDEANTLHQDSPWEGRVWSFTTADYLVVDDFEDYNDYTPDRIFESWLDGFGYGAPPPAPGPYYPGNGTGSIIGYDTPPFAELSIVHGGDQSMPYFYFNDLPGKSKYSEATKTLTYPRDWTEEGVKALTLWFRGYPASEGGYDYNAGTSTFTVRGAGTDIWNVTGRGTGYHDEFHFVYRTLSGAGSIQARVVSVQNTNGWAKAGVMIRDTLDANSVHSMVVVTPSNGVSWQYRLTAGGASTNDTQVTGITAPQWVRVSRDVSGLVTGEYSDNGSTWDTLGTPVQINMGTPMYIGLALTSHNAAATCEAVFSNVTFPTGTPSATWASQDIGIISNEAQPMYVAISNSNGPTGVVVHEDPNAALINTWTEWNIDLKDFADQGVVLSNVDKVAIGFGNRNNPVAGGSGIVYFDDIRLYRPRYVPGKGTPLEADFNGDGVVYFGDVEVMANDWLQRDYTVTQAVPNPAGLLVRWAFDEGFGTTAGDGSGNNHSGAITGAAYVNPGYDGTGYCLDFDPDPNEYVIDNDANTYLDGLSGITMSAWVKSNRTGTDKGFIILEEPVGNDDMDMRYDAAGATGGGTNVIKVGITSTAGIQQLESSSDVQTTDWQYVAMTWSSGNQIALYINGVLDTPTANSAPLVGTTTGTTQLLVGKGGKDAVGSWDGLIDEVRIYDYALSHGEILSLAGLSEIYVPVTSLAELYDSEPLNNKKVNFLDFAVLADQWLAEQVWPEW